MAPTSSSSIAQDRCNFHLSHKGIPEGSNASSAWLHLSHQEISRSTRMTDTTQPECRTANRNTTAEPFRLKAQHWASARPPHYHQMTETPCISKQEEPKFPHCRHQQEEETPTAIGSIAPENAPPA
ncbi:hypothetical protein Nepgr_022931 [Nepenthes gracilis]|uniref:Uncharacterized protein n=1 Tax=Nepenthes gracilis TaxID=150966 RepID=A0AAD3XYJ8_NEPGR|nr:hypothetical protein Nepgr_022931 [Nepenthes gracilis]